MSNFAQILAVEPLGPGRFGSIHNPVKMGNTNDIAYGGCTIGIAIKAAHYDVPESHRLYAAHGNFLGPALTDRRFFCNVKTYRSTKTFTTKSVEVAQKQDDGSERICLVALVDFHVVESASFMVYSAPPSKKYSSLEDSWKPAERKRIMIDENILSPQVVENHDRIFRIMSTLVDMRLTREGISSQNLQGFARGHKTTQDHLPLTKRTSADWLRSREELKTPAQHTASLAFAMDASISFLPLTLSSLALIDVGACSTLEFSLRLMSPDVNFNDWHLREWKTYAGDAARTYSEAALWDSNGKLVASMTQTSIMRPPRKAKSPKL